MLFKLPREGLTLEALFSPLKIVLQPLVTGGLLLILTWQPKKWHLLSGLATFAEVHAAQEWCAVLWGAGILYQTNRWLSRRYLNAFADNTEWDSTNELVVITGGSSGIGAAIRSRLASNGTRVIILDIQPPLEKIDNVFFYQTDISSSATIEQAAEKIRREHGDPTVLINNAGTGNDMLIVDQPTAETERIFNINILSHFHLVREFLPAMARQNHGHIVTVASMASFVTQGKNVSYACTKAAALAFHEGLTQELKHRYNAPKVRTTIVHPTLTRTPLVDHITRSQKSRNFCLEPETVRTLSLTRSTLERAPNSYCPVDSRLLGASAGFHPGFRS
ncbi:putative short-chain dehydrogenase/reductase 2 [Penicillium brasilianum]|uniref:Short-chain dehydrogenase/reductase 3 n=1 Tax=Penicillium brasilianum TaxID=104259 RepID=A0A1S9RAR3_PENBI|nr:putative short-chain dehydrogenase/reductase 2 [Penicillium brasilianum]